MEVKEIECTTGSWGFPFKLRSILPKRVHRLHEASISLEGVMLDDIRIAVNQPVAENGVNFGL
jgi:hypothetical protein